MDKLFWIDLEMTGLDVEKEVVIEVAAIVTDIELTELETATRPSCASPSRTSTPWTSGTPKHHGQSGLTAKVPLGTRADPRRGRPVRRWSRSTSPARR